MSDFDECTADELNENPTLAAALAAARDAMNNAWAPYSNFHVGAAIVTQEGAIYSGANVENATFGATVCAERSAVSAMVRAGERAIDVVVVATRADRPAAPCGVCRQVLAEFAEDAKIYSVDKHGSVALWTLDELLPHRFRGSDF